MNDYGNITTSQKTRAQNQGFTLIEILIVIAIVGILGSIAYPSYLESAKKSKRTDAQGMLMTASNAMERHFTSNGSYTGATPGTTFINQSPATGTANYTIAVAVPVGGSSYILTGTAVNSMSGDGNFTLSSTGVRTWGSNTCWAKSC